MSETRRRLIGELSPHSRRLLTDSLRSEHDAVAVVGMWCRFPGADSPERHWGLLAAGRHAVGEVPPDHWDFDEYHSLEHTPPPVRSFELEENAYASR